ncbi:MAG: methylmalonyl-CoA mutase family protein, partial [Caldilineaceae bacterium]
MIASSPNKLATLKQAWQEGTLAPLTKRFKERRERFTTSSDTIPVATTYTPDDLLPAGGDPEQVYMERLGFPGEFPYTRGVQANLYRG